VVERELTAYGHGLDERRRLVVLSKADLVDAGRLEEVITEVASLCRGQPPLVISAASGRGLEPLKAAVWGELGLEGQTQTQVQSS